MFLPSNITLKFGDSGDFVSELQRRLARVKCFDEAMVNGFFDGNTANAVTSFQAREGLATDGVAGPETLRRLNGVVSGDTSSSSSDDKKEEEKQQAAIATQNTVHFLAQQEADAAAFYQTPSHSPYGEDAYTKPTVETPAPQPVAPAPAIANVQEQIQRANELQAQQQALMAPQQVDPLAALVIEAQQRAAATPSPPARAELQSQAMDRPLDIQQSPRPPAPPPPPQPPRMEPPAPPMPPQQTPPEPAAAPAAEPAEQKGLIGRAMEKASGLVQKLHSYFEAKLPPSVLKEVQAIGVSLAQTGMKEAPIPTGPELQGKTPELPSRGTETTQGQQSG